MKRTTHIIIFAIAILTSMASAHAQSPREQLNQMVGQLQKTPTDNALREKIIKLAREVKPAPAVPEEAKRAFVMGGTYQKEAKSPEDFGLAVKAFQDATSAAPWWGDAYYNLSVALESAKRYDEAKNALAHYLLTNPKDAEEAQNRLYALDAKKVLAEKQAAIAARAQEEEKERLHPTTEGKWTFSSMFEFQIVRHGDRFVITSEKRFGELGKWHAANVTIDSQHVRFSADQYDCPDCSRIWDLTLSPDGKELGGTYDGKKLDGVNGYPATRVP